MAELNTIQFLQTLKECVKEYRKRCGETRDDSDAAHFFDANLKKFLLNHKSEMNVLSNMNFERPFIQWLKRYIYNEKPTS